MIVAFTDRRRSSDGSHSNVVRKSKRPSPPGQMIVAFSDRRPSDENRRIPSDGYRRIPSDRSHSHSSRKMERRPSSQSLRRPSRKQTLPAPMDPPVAIAVAPRRTKADMQPEGKVLFRSKEESAMTTNKGRSSTRRHSRSDVIVGFPERNPRVAKKREDPPGFLCHSTKLWGSFRTKHVEQPEPRVSSCRNDEPVQKPRHHAAKKTQDRHTRRFEDPVDWKQTSIDWGDEDEENSTEDGSSGGDEPSNARPCLSRQNDVLNSSVTTRDTSESLLSQSLSSLLSIRKLDSS